MSLASYLAAPPRGSQKSGSQVAGASSLCQGGADSRRKAAPCPTPLTVRELCDSLFGPGGKRHAHVRVDRPHGESREVSCLACPETLSSGGGGSGAVRGMWES